MTRLDPAQGRQRERLVGGVVVLVGVAVLVLAVIALVGAASGAGSDVAGPTVTLPRDSVSASPSASSSGASPSGASSSGASSSGSGSASATPTTSSTATTRGGTAAKQPLVVLNNTSRSGLAQQAAATFTQGGWTVSSTGNFNGDILSTCAYYDPSVTGAQAAAQALMQQFPAIKRVKERFGDLPSGPVVVVVTSDYTAQ